MEKVDVNMVKIMQQDAVNFIQQNELWILMVDAENCLYFFSSLPSKLSKPVPLFQLRK